MSDRSLSPTPWEGAAEAAAGGRPSTIELIILGLLNEGPMNAYAIAGMISERQISRFLKISTPAVYKTCRRLHKEHFVEAHTASAAERPDRVIYALNKTGQERFMELMRHYSSHLHPFYIDFNVFLWNTAYLPKNQALIMLAELQEQLKKMNQWIIGHEKEAAHLAFPSRSIVKQYRMIVETLVEWSRQMIRDFKREPK